MTIHDGSYNMPNMGCMLGTAYQLLAGELTAALDAAGLAITAPEYLILRILYNCNGLQICDIAAMLGKDKGAVSRTVKCLERKALVRTVTISHKCRKVFVTENGRDIEPRIIAIAQQKHAALAELLSADEMDALASILKRIIAQHKHERKQI